MPRAHKYFLPGRIWHLTHRCHQREFLLKFARDRRRWIWWLFEACKRFDLAVLNYVVTSNHVHLLVYAETDPQAISRSMQLIAGRTAQEYNLRKKRKGAFWEDRYHATAVEGYEHLTRCITYIHLNMVRAGVVKHPAEWEYGGYHEIAKPPRRYTRINRELLTRLVGLPGSKSLGSWQDEAIDRVLSSGKALARCPEWTESLAVGSRSYVEDVQEDLGLRARHRTLEGVESSESFVLHERRESYAADFNPNMKGLSLDNMVPWDLTSS